MAFIFYHNLVRVPDRAFRWQASQMSKSGDKVELLPVTTKNDFIAAWGSIASQAQSNGVKVSYVAIFSHAIKDHIGVDQDNGLEFVKDFDGSENTLGRNDILQMNILPWAENARLQLHACNSALSGERGWNPAEAFHQRQGVTVSGEQGYSYMSKQQDVYVDTSGYSGEEIYLYAYARRRNGPIGDGKRILPKMYEGRNKVIIDRLRSEIHSLEQQILIVSDLMNQLRASIKKLTTDLSELENQNSILVKEEDKIILRSRPLFDEYKLLSTEREEKKKQLEDMKQKRNRLIEEGQGQENYVNSLIDEYNKTFDDSLLEKIKAEERKLNEIVGAIKAHDIHFDTVWYPSFQQFAEKFASVRDKLQLDLDELKRLKEEIDSLNHRISNLRDNLKEKKSHITQKERSLENLKAQVQDKQRRVLELRGDRLSGNRSTFFASPRGNTSDEDGSPHSRNIEIMSRL